MDQKKLRELTKKEKERRGQDVPSKRRHPEPKAKPGANKRLAQEVEMPPPKVPKKAVENGEKLEKIDPKQVPVPVPEIPPEVPEISEKVEVEASETLAPEVNEAEDSPPAPPVPMAPAEPEGPQSTPMTEANRLDEEEPKGLPEGFFDDPDMDAKMRGEEAPSKKAERELEEGLKRFEREMQAEQEKAEEKRHEIDEEKYEVAAAEEQDFQVQLQSRLEKLRQQTANRKLNLPKEEEKADEDDTAVDDDDDDDDLALDWRAKGFSWED